MVESRKIASDPGQAAMELKWLWVLLLVIVLRALTPMFFKAAALELDDFTFMEVATNFLYWISLCFFGLRAIAWQIVLRHLPLSYVYPMSSMSLVLLMLVAHYYFGEPITNTQLIGAPLILVGSILIASSNGNGNA